MMIRSTAKNRMSLLRLLMVGLGLLAVQAATPAHADTHSYASARRQIKVCVLVSSAAPAPVLGGPENVTPYVFYILDRRTDLKPAGWEFVNPLASATITGDIYARWQQRGTLNSGDPTFANTPASAAFRTGQPLTKNFGAYWEVNLDNISNTDLQQFDVVLMAYHYNQTQFSTDEREKLRRFVDGGGTVWLEDEGGFDLQYKGNYGAGQFIVDLGFANAIPAASFPIPATQHHPLINFPYALSQVDIRDLGAAGVQYDVKQLHHTHQGLNNTFTGVNGLASPRVLVPVIWAGTASGQLPYVSAGDYGAGHIIVSSGGIATGINSYAGGYDVGEGGNSGAVSGEQTLGARPVDLKFAYNMIAWTSSVPTAGVNARRTNSSQEDVGAQLGERWATIAPQTPNTSAGSGAVIYKGVVFYVDGANVLHAYDASPAQDLDNDGNPDDGIPDYIYGAPYDEIWNTNLVGLNGTQTLATTRISTPTIASIVNPATGVPQDILLVSTSLGDTIAFDAFPLSGGVLAKTSPPIWSISSPDANPVDAGSDLTAANNILPSPSPVFSDGVVFTIWNQAGTDPNRHWHVAALDPLTGLEIFQETNNVGPTVAPTTLPAGTLGAGLVPGFPSPVGSLTAGYVRDGLTGALDKMIYVPTRTSQVTDTGAGTVQGVWFSTKGEPLEFVGDVSNLKDFSPKGQRKNLPWYLTPPPANGIDLRPVVYKRDVTGVLTRLRYQVDFTVQYRGGPPARNMVVTMGPAVSVAVTDSFTVDYTLDWPADPIPVIAGSGRPSFPEVALFSQRFLQFTPDPTIGGVNLPAMRIFGSSTLSPQDYHFVGLGSYPGGDRLYAYHEQFGGTTANIGVPGSRSKNNTELAWMFYPNAPNNTGIGGGGVAARMYNTDTFLPKSSGVATPPIDMFVSSFQQVGSPAYSNGVVYITGHCQLRSNLGAAQALPQALVVIALRANPDTTFTVTASDDSLVDLTNTSLVNNVVKLTQPDLVNSTALSPKLIELSEDVNFTLDRVSSTVHITDFRSHSGQGSGNAFNTALPFNVTVAGSNVAGPFKNKQTGFGILDNVLWWMAVPIGFVDNTGNQVLYPGTPYPAQWSGSNPPNASGLKNPSGLMPASGPTISGNTLYYGSTTGQVVSIDISGVSAGGGQVNVYKDDMSRVTAKAALISQGVAVQQPIFSPPVATTGIVAVGTPQGLAALDNQLTLITDNNRLIEVTRSGDAAWTMEATKSNRLVQSAGGGSAQIGALLTSLSRPNMAHIYALNDYVIADTGNNRVVELDHGGIVTWELSRLNNGLRFLRENDPVALNQPTDIQTYNTSGTGTLSFTSPVTNLAYTYTPGAGGSWFAIHYIIADSGNFRALEVVDVYDANGNPVVMTGADGTFPVMQRQVVFTTRAYGEQNQALRYRTIQQFGNFENGLFRTYMVAAIDNVRQAGDLNPGAANIGTNTNDVKGPGSSLMILKRYPPAGQGVDGDTAALINSIVYPNQAGTGILQRQTISNPRWFKEFNVANPLNPAQPSLHYTLADANGVYVLVPGTGAFKGEAVVEWALSNDDYYYMTGRHLNANSIQKVSQADYDTGTNTFYPHYLITNGYTGRDNIFEIFGQPTNILDGEMHGEVVEVRSDYYFVLNGGHFNPNGGYRSAAARLYQNPAGILSANPSPAITWMVPKETIPVVPPLPAPPPPPSVIVRKIGNGSGGTSTGLLEQPTFSDRPF